MALPFAFNHQQNAKNINNMGGYRVKRTREKFIEDSIKIHGDKYDYSKVDYVNNKTKVCIICKKHGEFWQEAGGHLKGYGCRECYIEEKKNKKLVSGVGINDYDGRVQENGKELKSYQTWRNMLARCYCQNTRNRYKTYEDCEVCEEWKRFSNFKKWFDEHYIEGYDMDKDLLCPDSRTYSAETCVFVPHKINVLFREVTIEKECPSVGVSLHKNNRKYKYRTVVRVNGKQAHCGGYNSIEEAHQVFIRVKTKELCRIATECYNKGEIDYRIYNAMINYKIA